MLEKAGHFYQTTHQMNSQHQQWEQAISDLAQAVASKHGFTLRSSRLNPAILAQHMGWEPDYSDDNTPLLGGRVPWAWGPLWSEEREDFVTTTDSSKVLLALVHLGAVG